MLLSKPSGSGYWPHSPLLGFLSSWPGGPNLLVVVMGYTNLECLNPIFFFTGLCLEERSS